MRSGIAARDEDADVTPSMRHADMTAHDACSTRAHADPISGP